jgi:DNA-binding HxlR family transcriptional regulator
MRSYGQSCALAKALDVIGDRWTLLIVRELMIRDGCRYTDLRNGLPGIATNLLAERLNELEAAGLVIRDAAPPPIATTLFRLTERGKDLEPIIAALGRWGAPLLARDAAKKDNIRDHWVVLPLRLYVRDLAPQDPPIRVALRAGEEDVVLETVGDGSIRVEAKKASNPQAKIEGAPQLILALLAGRITLPDARKKGLRLEGDASVVRRFAAR